MPDIRVNDLPVLAAPTDDDVLHAIDDADDKDKQLTVGALKAYAQTGTATAAQGAKADTALQPGSVNLDTTATTATRTVTNTAGAAAVLPTFDTNAGLVPGTASDTTNFLRADGTWTAPPSGTGTVTNVSGTVPIDVATGTTTPVVSIRPASGSSPGSMSLADFNKLAGVATGATANSTDAQLRDRGTHTGTQAAATISDFTASSRAQVEATLTAGSNITLTATGSGATRSIAIASTASGGGDTVTSVTGTAPIQVASGTTTPAITITAATPSLPGSMSAADKTKLDGVATGATANSTDAQLRDRSTHTGTQAGSTVTGAYIAAGLTMATARLLGRNTAGTGAAQEIVLGTNLSFSGTTLNATGGSASDLDSLTDVTITTPATDQVLKYNGTVWVNAAAPGGGGGTVTQVDGGAGLTGSVTTTGALAVGAGTGISVAADAVAVDRTVVDTWYATAAQGTLAGTAVQSVVGTLPITAIGTTTRTVGINAATPSLPGSMSAADKTKLDAITGTNTGDNSPNSLYSGLVSNATHTGDATGATALTLATVNANVGAFGSATQVATFTVNAKGLTTAAANVTVTPAWSSVTATPTTRSGYGITDAAANGDIASTGITLSGPGLAGRSTAGPGSATLITLGTNLSFTGNTLNAVGGAGTVTSVTGTAPIQVVTGTTTPAITISAATTSAAGSMSAADKTKLDGIIIVGSGTAALGTAAIASGANATVVAVAAAGVLTTDVINWGFNTNPNAVTGYSAASTAGCLVITAFPTAGTVNFVVSNPTAGSITPGALTLNWRVAR